MVPWITLLPGAETGKSMYFYNTAAVEVSVIIDGKDVAAIMKQVRRERPLVHQLTNYVTMADCAAVTSSVGAVPVMAQAEEEVEEMVATARAAVINTGTLSPERVRSMLRMGKKAGEKGIPVVFDPVGAGSTSYRTNEIKSLLQEVNPHIIKGNSSEIALLAGMSNVSIRGIEALKNDHGDPITVARRLRTTLNTEAVIIITGEADLIDDGMRTARVLNGHALLPEVVGSGCMASSVLAAFAALEHDYFVAAVAALAALGVAAELAAQADNDGIPGPAAFKTRWLDNIFFLSEKELIKRFRVEMD